MFVAGPIAMCALPFPMARPRAARPWAPNHDNDTGLMRITDRGPWPHAAMGDLQQARVGDWVLALGHPGGFDLQRSLVVRLGRIIRLDAGHRCKPIAPSAPATPADRSSICTAASSASTAPSAASLAENFHVPVTEFYEGWNLLVEAPAGNEPADEAPGLRRRQRRG